MRFTVHVEMKAVSLRIEISGFAAHLNGSMLDVTESSLQKEEVPAAESVEVFAIVQALSEEIVHAGVSTSPRPVASTTWLEASAVREEARCADGGGHTEEASVAVDDFDIFGIVVCQMLLIFIECEQWGGRIETNDLADFSISHILAG